MPVLIIEVANTTATTELDRHLLWRREAQHYRNTLVCKEKDKTGPTSALRL